MIIVLKLRQAELLWWKLGGEGEVNLPEHPCEAPPNPKLFWQWGSLTSLPVLCDLGQVPLPFWTSVSPSIKWDVKPIVLWGLFLSGSHIPGVCVSPPLETKASEAWFCRSPGPGRGNSWGQAGQLPIVQERRRRRCMVLSKVTAGWAWLGASSSPAICASFLQSAGGWGWEGADGAQGQTATWWAGEGLPEKEPGKSPVVSSWVLNSFHPPFPHLLFQRSREGRIYRPGSS